MPGSSGLLGDRILLATRKSIVIRGKGQIKPYSKTDEGDVETWTATYVYGRQPVGTQHAYIIGKARWDMNLPTTSDERSTQVANRLNKAHSSVIGMLIKREGTYAYFPKSGRSVKLGYKPTCKVRRTKRA